LKLNGDQLDAIQRLREQFLTKIGGNNQNPNDPQYLKRWREAQPEFDEHLMIMIGSEAFNQYQVNAARLATYGHL
jgi:hypothetical protein